MSTSQIEEIVHANWNRNIGNKHNFPQTMHETEISLGGTISALAEYQFSPTCTTFSDTSPSFCFLHEFSITAWNVPTYPYFLITIYLDRWRKCRWLQYQQVYVDRIRIIATITTQCKLTMWTRFTKNLKNFWSLYSNSRHQVQDCGHRASALHG